MILKTVILNINQDGTVKCYHGGVKMNVPVLEGINLESIPLNGVGLVDCIRGTFFLVGYEKLDAFQAFLEVHA